MLLKRNLKLKELISSNVSKINKHLDELSSEVGYLVASLEFTQKINKKLVQLKKEKKALKAEVEALEDDLLNANEVSSKLIKLEDRSRRNNL